MRKVFVLLGITLLAFTGVLCRKAKPFPEEQYDPRLSGGSSTVFLSNAHAFSAAVPGLDGYDEFVHELGDKLFEQTFVSAPAPKFPGLGPLYNNVSCASCHHNDGKGIPTAGLINSGLLTRISMPGVDQYGAPLPVTGFGTQLQDKAIGGKSPEGKLSITYQEETFTYLDGSTAQLRKPIFNIINTYIPLPAGHFISVRLGPPVFGLGLLELVPESTILSLADENDANGDGISGRPNYVHNPYNNQTALGRFGLKANNVTILQQVASAFHQDIGVTTTLFPQESAHGQPQFDGLGDDPEISDSMLNAVSFYIQTLAVPARRDVTNTNVLLGEKLFKQLNCSGCHTPLLLTGTEVRIPALSNQRIQPFTDLLLHDMGDALADGKPDFRANGNEWRTPPLWGIGLLSKVNGNAAFYLHDGRARNLEEAILWHGGEAQKSRDAYTKLTKTERATVITFLQSL